VLTTRNKGGSSISSADVRHVRRRTGPTPRTDYAHGVAQMEAEWDSCKAPDAAAETPPGNAFGEQGQGRGRSAERATLVNSPARTASLQDLGRRTPSPDLSNYFECPTPPPVKLPRSLTKRPDQWGMRSPRQDPGVHPEEESADAVTHVRCWICGS
jgi:hypothetical protein